MADLNADIFQRLHPKAYLERFLAEQLRPDGREAADWRDLYVHVGSISTADGSALVRLGHTTIVCGVKAEIAEPDLEQPTEGFLGSHFRVTKSTDSSNVNPPLVPNIDLPAMCAPRFKPGPPSEEAQVLSDRLASTITACATPFNHPLLPDIVTLTAQAFSPSQRYAYTPSAPRGCYTSMRHVLIMTATRSMPRSLRWSLHSKTVRILITLVSRVPSNCKSGIPK
jgi:hypothetical protein